MDTGVRLSWALDPASGETYHIDDPLVQRGKASGLVCGHCGMLMVAKKGDDRAWHFAHPSSGQTGEGCRHWDAVWDLYRRIRDALRREEPVPFRWQCKICGREHTGDFVKGATSVHRETMVQGKGVKPDISLYNGDAPHRFIEVVDTNPPKQHVREYARERGVNLVVVRVKENTDLSGTIKAEVLEGGVCPTPPRHEPVPDRGPHDSRVIFPFILLCLPRHDELECMYCKQPLQFIDAFCTQPTACDKHEHHIYAHLQCWAHHGTASTVAHAGNGLR